MLMPSGDIKILVYVLIAWYKMVPSGNFYNFLIDKDNLKLKKGFYSTTISF